MKRQHAQSHHPVGQRPAGPPSNYEHALQKQGLPGSRLVRCSIWSTYETTFISQAPLTASNNAMQVGRIESSTWWRLCLHRRAIS